MITNTIPQPKKVLSIQRTIYPLDYNKNNKKEDAGFNMWIAYIHKTQEQVAKDVFINNIIEILESDQIVGVRESDLRGESF